ncbi:hypothetical protein MMC17_006287 [Xylographa soralifera]|nr:hypothetical protein [Xylographa soralifera]
MRGDRQYDFEVLDENRPLETRNGIPHEDPPFCSERTYVQENEQSFIGSRKRKSIYSQGNRHTRLHSSRHTPTRVHDPIFYAEGTSISLGNSIINFEPVTPRITLDYPITDDPDDASTITSSSRKSTISSELALSTPSPCLSITPSEVNDWVESKEVFEDPIQYKGRRTSAEPQARQHKIHQQIPAHHEQTSLNFVYPNANPSASTIIDPSSKDQGNWAGESWFHPPIIRPVDGTTALLQHTYEFEVYCDLLSFMQRHYGEDCGSSTLGSVISLSGTARHAQATTTADYLESNWPKTGPLTLDALQGAMNSEDHIFQVSHTKAELDFDVHISETIRLRVAGSSRSIREISRQLEWIGCAFRFSNDDRIEYSRTIKISDNPAVFRFEQEPVPSDEDEFGCWFPLFTNAVIAHGFPIPSRANNEKGLDISFDVMIALSGVQYSATFEGGTILKGFLSMLIPTVSYPGSVQWHFRYSDTEDQLDYRQVQQRQRILVSEMEMRKKRAFLGWCKRAEIHLGTRGTNHSELRYSSAREPGSQMILTGIAPNLNAGISNISAGLTFQLKFGARDGNIHFSRKGSLKKIISWAEKSPVILYEPEEKRGWLVPASGVILHMFHTRLHKAPLERWGLPIESTYADPSRYGSKAARVALESLVSPETIHFNPIFKKFNGTAALTPLEEIILEIWGILDVCLCCTKERNKTPGIAIQNPRTLLQGSQKLQGYEYMDIVEQDSSVRLKSKDIGIDHGGWVDLAKDINCLVLFGCGFKDIIKPAPGSIPCQSWKKLPEKKDYLAAGAAIIQHLFDRAGSSSTLKNLTTKSNPLQWRVPQDTELFESCENTREHPCRCKRLQRLVRQRSFLLRHSETASPPKHIEIDGAILFGAPTNKIRKDGPDNVEILDSSNIVRSPQSGDTNPPTFTPTMERMVSTPATSPDEAMKDEAMKIDSPGSIPDGILLAQSTNPSHHARRESEKHASPESGSENTIPTEPPTDPHSAFLDNTPPRKEPSIDLFGHNR